MGELSLTKMGFYTRLNEYMFINEDLKSTKYPFSFAGDFVISLANFETDFLNLLLGCSLMAFFEGNISIIKNTTNRSSVGEYLLAKIPELQNIATQAQNLVITRSPETFEMIKKHYLFKTFPIDKIVDFIRKDFYEIYCNYELPVVARVVLLECMNALYEFEQNTPEIGAIEFANLCKERIEHFKDVSIEIIDKNYSIVNKLRQNISVDMVYLPETKQAVSFYSLSDLESLLAFDAVFLQTNGVTIKKCENCGKYFTPLKRVDEIYCDSMYENGKTCKQIGYENKLKKDVFKTAYRRAYKTQRARIKYNSHIHNYEELHFKPWEAAAKKALEKYTSQNDIDGFERWLKDNRDSF